LVKGKQHAGIMFYRHAVCLSQDHHEILLRKLEEVKAVLIIRMHDPLEEVGKWLASVIRGFTNYHAVPGNMKAPREFYTQIGRLWIRVIRRRSQKARCRWT
jgi:hypothetical protein